VRKRDDGRFITRVPKIGVLKHLKRDDDYVKETLLPIGRKLNRQRTLKHKKKFKNKTRHISS
jgi:hypothetical protein